MQWCRQCGNGSSIRLWICPRCGLAADWADECPVPVRPYVLTVNDWTLLKQLHIDPETPKPNYSAPRESDAS